MQFQHHIHMRMSEAEEASCAFPSEEHGSQFQKPHSSKVLTSQRPDVGPTASPGSTRGWGLVWGEGAGEGDRKEGQGT